MQTDLQKLRLALVERISSALPNDDARLSQAMRYSAGQSGKLYRPLFGIYVGLALGANYSELLTIGAAVELLHNFTLVHDDIMDAARMRRGKPTVHVHWDTNLAILTGDALFARSLEILLSLNHQKAQVLEIFIRSLPALSRGQALDLEQMPDKPDSIEDYRRMAAWKTGSIFSMAGEMAAVLAEAAPETRLLIKDLGVKLGIAYQLKDDYLDLFGEEHVTKKTLGHDLTLQRRSLVMSLGFKAAHKDLTEAIILAQIDPVRGLHRARIVLVQSGVEQAILNELGRTVAECLELVAHLPAKNTRVAMFIDLMLRLPDNPHNP